MSRTVKVEACDCIPGAWVVEVTDENGKLLQTIFTGPLAHERADEYARYLIDITWVRN